MSGVPRVLASLAVLGALVARPARAGESWESEIRREVEDEDVAIEQAQRAKTMKAVVQKYASRAQRDDSALSHFLLGRALFYADDPSGARTQMNAALAVEPGFWPAHVKLAQLAAEQKDWTGADDHLKAALARNPHDPEARNVAAMVALERSDWSAAIGHLSVRIADDPGDRDSRRKLAYAYYQRKDYDASIRELETLRASAPNDRNDRVLLSQVLGAKGRVDEAIALLEDSLKNDPQDLVALNGLRTLYARKKDVPKLTSVLERMLPLVSGETKTMVSEMLDYLRHPPRESAASPAAPDEPKPPTIEEIAAATESPDVERRREALRMLYEACSVGAIQRVPEKVILRRLRSDVEPDVECRSWVVKTMSLLPRAVTVLRAALYDESPKVRALAMEALGECGVAEDGSARGQPIAYVFLAPFLDEPLTIDAFNVLRTALSLITGFHDLPPGVERIATDAQMAEARTAWRKWALSDESTPIKLLAVKQVLDFGPDLVKPEYVLIRLVDDPTFEVMRAAYVAMRTVCARAPEDALDRKMLPSFPKRADAEITKASMREIQDAVDGWWRSWLAERAVLRSAK